MLRPLDGPFGMEVLDIDLTGALPDRTIKALNLAMVKHQVLLFRNQNLTDARMRELASWFGKVRVLSTMQYGGRDGGIPGVRHLTNLGDDGKFTQTHPDPFSREWHADGAWMRTPARATLLYAIEVPEQGGDTRFADMYGGLQAFSESERRRLETLEVIHDVELSRVMRFGQPVNRGRSFGVGTRVRHWWRFLSRMLPGRASVHPVIRTPPDGDRPAIVLGCDAWRIRGMGWLRGMREVDELTRRSIRPERTLTHHWRPGDLVLWDNRSILHQVTEYDFRREARVMRQVVIAERTAQGRNDQEYV